MRRRERGVALVVVMWVSILLTVIASSFIYEARTDALVVRNTISMARAEGIADAAVYRALFELYRADNAPDAWRRDGTVRDTVIYSIVRGEWPEIKSQLHYRLSRHAGS